MRSPRHRPPSTDVTVRRVEHGSTYARVNSVGDEGERGFVLVLVPGIGVSSNYFERLAPNLNEYGPVHALDLPGFGGVPHPQEAMTIADFAELVGAAIDQLGLTDPILVGHSMGTQIVIELAVLRPELTTIVLIGPVVNRAERRVLIQGVRFLQSAVREPGRVKGLALSAYLLCGVRWFSRVLPAMMRYRSEDRITEIESPVLLIRGELDAVCPRPWIDELAKGASTSKSWEIPGAAHSVMYANAEAVAELCVRYARDPGADDDRLRDKTDAVSREPRLSPKERRQRTIGRLRELVGIVTQDDDKIEQGKTEQSVAQGDDHG